MRLTTRTVCLIVSRFVDPALFTYNLQASGRWMWFRMHTRPSSGNLVILTYNLLVFYMQGRNLPA